MKERRPQRALVAPSLGHMPHAPSLLAHECCLADGCTPTNARIIPTTACHCFHPEVVYQSLLKSHQCSRLRSNSGRYTEYNEPCARKSPCGNDRRPSSPRHASLRASRRGQFPRLHCLPRTPACPVPDDRGGGPGEIGRIKAREAMTRCCSASHVRSLASAPLSLWLSLSDNP